MYPGPTHKVYITREALLRGYRKNCGYDKGRVIGNGVIVEQSVGGIFKPVDREDAQSLHVAAFGREA
jgi:hypothetical protein